METKVEEIWKDVVGYEAKYYVSTLGRIKNAAGLIMKCRITREGYLGIALYKDGKHHNHKIHKIEADSFFGINPGLVTDHINNNKLDNRITNLQRITKRFNSTKDTKNSTGFKGVVKRKCDGKYLATIRIKGKKTYLGVFKTPELAHISYINAVKKHDLCTFEMNSVRHT